MREVNSRIDVYGFTHALSALGHWRREGSHKANSEVVPVPSRPEQCGALQSSSSRSSSQSQKVMPYLARPLPISAANREPEPDMDRFGA